MLFMKKLSCIGSLPGDAIVVINRLLMSENPSAAGDGYGSGFDTGIFHVSIQRSDSGSRFGEAPNVSIIR